MRRADANRKCRKDVEYPWFSCFVSSLSDLNPFCAMLLIRPYCRCRYCQLCTKLKREKPELPHVFASALSQQLATQSAASKASKRTANHSQGAAGEELEDEDADADDRDSKRQEGGAEATAVAGGVHVDVEVCGLEETFSGAIRLSASGAQPLKSRKLAQVRFSQLIQ